MAQRLRSTLTLALVGMLLMISPSDARQPAGEGFIVQRSDGTLFLVQQGLRYRVDPVPLTDAEIDAIPDAGVVAELTHTPRGALPIDGAASRVLVEPGPTLGWDPARPIPPGVICRCTADRRGRVSVFEISIDEVQRDGWPLVQRANRFNPAPDATRAYVALKISIRYVHGPTDDAFMVSATDFKLVGSDRMLRPIASIIEPEPWLGGDIYPGALLSGYVVYTVRPREDDLQVLWENNFTGERGVWFAIS